MIKSCLFILIWQNWLSLWDQKSSQLHLVLSAMEPTLSFSPRNLVLTFSLKIKYRAPLIQIRHDPFRVITDRLSIWRQIGSERRLLFLSQFRFNVPNNACQERVNDDVELKMNLNFTHEFDDFLEPFSAILCQKLSHYLKELSHGILTHFGHVQNYF